MKLSEHPLRLILSPKFITSPLAASKRHPQLPAGLAVTLFLTDDYALPALLSRTSLTTYMRLSSSSEWTLLMTRQRGQL